MPAMKKNGAVQICDDKVTINPALYVHQYPLSRIEDIFALLASGKHDKKEELHN